MQRIDRRSFLQCLGAGVGIGGSLSLFPRSLAALPRTIEDDERRLVLVQLSGYLDRYKQQLAEDSENQRAKRSFDRLSEMITDLDKQIASLEATAKKLKS